jgi:hypothetical protein
MTYTVIGPIAYTDEQLRIVMDAALPLAPSAQSNFLEAVSRELLQHLPRAMLTGV